MEPTPLRRALTQAPERATAVKAAAVEEFFCFRLGPLYLGVPSRNVREVFRIGPLTPLPRVPSFVLGVCGHRGEVLPVLDLLRLLGKGEGKIGPRTRLFVGVSDDIVAGILSDGTTGLRKIPTADVLPPPVGGDAASEHLLGVVPGRDREPVLNLLHFSKLLQSAHQRTVVR